MSHINRWLKYPLPILDTLIWYAYLMLLIAVSFVNDYYSSQTWLLLSAGIYVICGLCVFSAINGGRCNWVGLKRVKLVLLIMFAMLLLLLLQMTLPISRHSDLALHSGFALHSGLALLSGASSSGITPEWYAPEWFAPAGRWSIVPEKTRWLFNSELLIFSTFVLSIALVCSRRRLKQLLTVVLIVGVIHSLVGIFAKYGGLTLVDIKQLDGHFTAARGWFINRNHFAAFISLCLVSALALQVKSLMSAKRARPVAMILAQLMSYRIANLFALTVGIIAIVLSQSRAGFLAFFLSLLLVMIVFGNGRSVKSLGFRRRNLILPATSIVLAVILYFGGDLLQRFSSDTLLGERLSQWSLTWQAIEHAWLFGYGGNSYADVFQAFRGYQDFRQVVFNQAHNDYLHIWLEQGLVGLALWVGLLAIVLMTAFRGFSTSASQLSQAVLISVSVVLIAALAQSAVDFNLQILNIRVYFFVIMSLVFSVPAIRHRKRAPGTPVPV
jgi:hypothetical protein